MALIAVLLGMLLFSIMGTTMVFITANNLASSNEDLTGSQAFYVAEGGMQYVEMSQLNGDANFSDNVSPTDPPFGARSINLFPGKFWVEYVNPQQSSMTVRLTAKVGNAVRVIEQQAAQHGTGRQYVAMVGGNLNANNANGDIYGDLGLKGQANLNEPATMVHGNIYQDPTLQLPTLDFNTYKNMCSSTYQGSKTFSSNYTGNLCVTGSATINANVTYTGLLYVMGSVSINGNNVVINGTLISDANISADHRKGLQFKADASNPSQHMPAIAAKGNVSIKDSDEMVVKGVVWGSGNIDLSNSDDLKYTGSFMSGGNVLLNSAREMSITFDSSFVVGVPGLSGFGGAQSGSLTLSGWKTYAPWW